MNVSQALKHRNVLGAGAAKRRKLKSEDEVFTAVMKEFGRGTLHSGSGKIVKKRSQARAIGVSESKRFR